VDKGKRSGQAHGPKRTASEPRADPNPRLILGNLKEFRAGKYGQPTAQDLSGILWYACAQLRHIIRDLGLPLESRLKTIHALATVSAVFLHSLEQGQINDRLITLETFMREMHEREASRNGHGH
jgi:hypothetical protein